MFNKKIAYLITFVIFATAFYGSYSYFLNSSGVNLLSPLTKEKASSSNSKLVTEAVIDNEPKTEECPLNGAFYSKTQKGKWEKRRPMGIMIENHVDARPQSGLSSADIIYEAVAEGGITRFLSIFYCQDAKFVGPVRSARIYFLNMLREYGESPLYAHVGGANTDGPADALGKIENLGWAQYNDLNQFSVPFPNFWRDYDRLPNRDTEHTVYTSTSKLWDFSKTKRNLSNVDKKGKSWDSSFTKWSFKDEAKLKDRGETGAKISFGFWDSFASDFAVTWTYDQITNSYKRENGGKPHIDKNSNKQMETKNVVIMFADESSANDGYPGGHLLYDILGEGKAIVFQNGEAIKAKWSKKKETTRMKITDNSGKEMSFVRGQIFVEILPTGNQVTY